MAVSSDSYGSAFLVRIFYVDINVLRSPSTLFGSSFSWDSPPLSTTSSNCLNNRESILIPVEFHCGSSDGMSHIVPWKYFRLGDSLRKVVASRLRESDGQQPAC